MTKKSLNQNAKYSQEIIETVEPNFKFNECPINRFKIVEKTVESLNNNKKGNLLDLKKKINSIENCILKNNSKRLILGDGDIDSPIMLVGETPGIEEETLGLSFQGEMGVLLNKMFIAIGIKREKLYCTYSINFRTLCFSFA